MKSTKKYIIKYKNKFIFLSNNELIKNLLAYNVIKLNIGGINAKIRDKKIYDLLHFHILQKENLILLNKVFIKITPKRTVISIIIVVDGKNKVNYFLIYNALIPTDTIVNVFLSCRTCNNNFKFKLAVLAHIA